MKELSIHIKIHMYQNSHSYTYGFMCEEFDFDPTPEESNAGIIYNCDKDIVIEKPSSDVLKEFMTAKDSIVEISDTKGKHYRIGNNQIPAYVSIVPHLNTATLKIRCKMLFSPLI